MDFSGWFSPRSSGGGNASIAIHEGTGGAVLATVGVAVPADPGVPPVYPWRQHSGSVAVPTGIQISYVVAMGNNVNFDDAFMAFSTREGPCPTALLSLQVQWVNATVGDAAIFSASRGGGALGELSSTATSVSHSDVLAAPLYVASGDAIDLAEIQQAFNQSGYIPALSCSGAGTLSGDALAVNDSGDRVDCTLTLTRDLAVAGVSAQPVPLTPGATRPAEPAAVRPGTLVVPGSRP